MAKNIMLMLLLFSTVSTTVADTTISFEKAKKARTQEERRTAFREQYENLSSVTVYGKVVDQYGDPVKEAEVLISWEEATWLIGIQDHGQKKRICVGTDGYFQFSCEKPWEIDAEAFKDGYETPVGGGRKLFSWGRGAVEKNKPVTITLRKKGTTTFLVVSPSVNLPPDELFQTKGTNDLTQPLDILTWHPDARWRRCATSSADLRIDAAYDSDKECWNVTYSVTNGAGGIVLSDTMLYEAPADGYAPSVDVTVTNVYDWRRYLYVKSREPAVYSRVLFEHNASIGENPSLRVSCKAWINPYGERSLEYDERFEKRWRVREALTAESIAAIRSKKLPSKPDIAQRIKEMDERVAREEAEKERRHKEWIERQKKQKEGKLE